MEILTNISMYLNIGKKTNAGMFDNYNRKLGKIIPILVKIVFSIAALSFVIYLSLAVTLRDYHISYCNLMIYIIVLCSKHVSRYQTRWFCSK